MNIGLDIDGTIDAFPILFQSWIAAWNAAGHRVYIITGIEGDTVQDSDYMNKAEYLTAMGIPATQYYKLIIVPSIPGVGHADAKAEIIQKNAISALIDNNVNNCKAAKKYCAVFLMYNVKEKGASGISEPRSDNEPHSHGTETHSHSHRSGQMCCDGRTAAQHRATSSDGKCCTDAKVSDDGTDTASLTGTK
jgi:hypothetical protein